MEWNFGKSEEFKKTIAKNEELMRALSAVIEKVFKEHGIKLKNKSYVFEPRVFHGDPSPWRPFPGLWPLPFPGIIDPSTLQKLDKLRIFKGKERLFEDLIPEDTASLIKRIVGDTELLEDLSKSIFNILQKNGITFKDNEGCVFIPSVFETPIHAKKVPIIYESQQISKFNPQMYVGSMSQPYTIKLRPFPGIIDVPEILPPTPGVIVNRWWWIGIPAPEMLRALDILREMKHI